MSFSSATVSTGDVTKKSDYDRLMDNTIALKATTNTYNITSSSTTTVDLPDANSVVSNRLYRRTGAGSGTVLFNAYGSQTINGIADTNWVLEDEETILLAPITDGWRVLLYGGYDESGNLVLKPASGGRIVFDNGETWHEVGASGEPAFENGWGAFADSSYDVPQFYKDAEGFVHVKGMAAGGSINDNMWTFPTGYRPSKHIILNAISNNAIARVDVYPAGAIRPVTGNNTWVSLNGIIFYAGY